jgi:hypothetical protein
MAADLCARAASIRFGRIPQTADGLLFLAIERFRSSLPAESADSFKSQILEKRNHTQPATPLATMPTNRLLQNLHSPSGDNGWIGRPKRIRTGYGWSYRLRGSIASSRESLSLADVFCSGSRCVSSMRAAAQRIFAATIQLASNAVNFGNCLE